MFNNSLQILSSLEDLDFTFLGLCFVGVLALTLGAFKYIEAKRSPVCTTKLFLIIGLCSLDIEHRSILSLQLGTLVFSRRISLPLNGLPRGMNSFKKDITVYVLFILYNSGSGEGLRWI